MTYVPNAIEFDGASRLDRGGNLTGIANSKLCLCSFWLLADPSGDGIAQEFFNSDTNDTQIIRTATNRIFVFLRDPTNTVVVDLTSGSAAYSSAGGWIHVLFSWDIGNNNKLLYRNDVADPWTVNTFIDALVDYNATNWSIGADVTGAGAFIGTLSDFYFTTEYLDISVEANRRKFIDAEGNPVFLGNDGELPTGTPPLVYMRGNPPDMGVNSGSGGNFSEIGDFPDRSPGPVVLTPPQEVILARRSGRYHRYFRG